MRDKLFGKYRALFDMIVSWTILIFAVIGMVGTYYDIKNFFNSERATVFLNALAWMVGSCLGVVILIAFIKTLFNAIRSRGGVEDEDDDESMITPMVKPKNYDHISDKDMIEWLERNKNRLSYYDLGLYAKHWKESKDVTLKILNLQRYWIRNKSREKDMKRGEIIRMEKGSPLSLEMDE